MMNSVTKRINQCHPKTSVWDEGKMSSVRFYRSTNFCKSVHNLGQCLSVCVVVCKRCTFCEQKLRVEGRISWCKGPFINSVTRDGPFFRSKFTPPLPSRSVFTRFRCVTLFFAAVHLISVYFGFASRSKIAVRKPRHARIFFEFTTPPSRVTEFMNGP